MTNETWGWVIGQESLFEVSTKGSVRSYKGVGRYPKLSETPRIIKPCKDARGYYNFTVRKDGKPKVLLIHIEEAKTFIPNPNNYKLVRHLNDIKTDNDLDNLAWGTHADNRADGIKNGKHFHCKGERPAKAKLTESQVIIIMESEKNNTELAREFGVTESTISKVRVGRGWNKITGLPYIRGNRTNKIK